MSRISRPILTSKTVPELSVALGRWANLLVDQLNKLSEGRLAARHNAITAAPTTGSYAVGDFVSNSTPSELGAASSKYVIIGWICVTAGSPGTFLECRCLTGN